MFIDPMNGPFRVRRGVMFRVSGRQRAKRSEAEEWAWGRGKVNVDVDVDVDVGAARAGPLTSRRRHSIWDGSTIDRLMGGWVDQFNET